MRTGECLERKEGLGDLLFVTDLRFVIFGKVGLWSGEEDWLHHSQISSSE